MNFDGVRVLVVGDVMLDHYIAGQVKRISPEAPVPVLSVTRKWVVPGGAANVARNLARLGVQVALAGVVGADPAADDLRSALAHAENFAERIKELGGEPTTQKEGKIVTGQEVTAIYEADADQEDRTIEAYSAFLAICKEAGDIVSARLFERIIDEEQIHLTYYDNIDGHIKKLGDTYLAKIAGTPSSTGAASKGFVTGPTAAAG